MRGHRAPPTVGIGAAVGFVVLVFAPYVALSETETGGLSVYYDYGVAGPQFLAVLAAVAVVLFAAGREGRTDRSFVAGITVVLGLVLVSLIAAWALAVPGDVVASLGSAAWLEYHRWLVLASAVLIAASAGWYVRALSLV